MRNNFIILSLMSVLCLPCHKTLGQEAREKEVTFENGSITLAGTVAYPEGEGPFPAVILISGSGPQDRNSTLMGFMPFKLISDYLTTRGIAVLRYDDRGTGESTGESPMSVTSVALSTDVQAAYRFLLSDPDVEAKKIGLLGHSEGGIIAPMVAAANEEIAFVVLMAGYGVKGMEVTLVQQEAIMKAQGLDDAMVKGAVDTNRKVLALLDLELTDEAMDDSVRTYMVEMYNILPPEMQAQVSEEAFISSQVTAVKAQLQSPWTKFFLTYDPAPVLSKITCPVLLLFGGKDTQVLASQNQEIMENALEAGGNDLVSVMVYPEANHLFQKANTGSPSEYQTLDKKFVEGFLPALGDWMINQVN
jgi:dienelactone hydrolase